MNVVSVPHDHYMSIFDDSVPWFDENMVELVRLIGTRYHEPFDYTTAVHIPDNNYLKMAEWNHEVAKRHGYGEAIFPEQFSSSVFKAFIRDAKEPHDFYMKKDVLCVPVCCEHHWGMMVVVNLRDAVDQDLREIKKERPYGGGEYSTFDALDLGDEAGVQA